MHRRQTATFLLAVLVASSTTGAKQAGDGPTNACQELKFIKRLTTKFEAEITGAQDRLTTLKNEGRAFSLAACCTSDTTQASQLRLLQALAEKRAMDTQAKIEANKAILSEAITRLKKRETQLQTALQMEPQVATKIEHTYKAAARHLIGAGGANDKTCELSTTQAFKNADICTTDNSRDEQIDGDVKALADLQTFKGLDDSAFVFDKIKTAIATIGEFGANGAAAADDKSVCTSNAGHTTKTVTDGVIADKFTRDPAWKNTVSIDMGTGPDKNTCTDDESYASHNMATKQATAYAICTARGVSLNTKGSVAKQTVKSLAGDEDAQEIASLILTEPTAEPTGDGEKKKAVETLLGTDGETIADKFLKDIGSNKLTFKSGSKTIDGGVNALSHGSDFTTAIGYCLGNAHRNNKKQKQTQPDKQKKDCKGSKENDCDKEKCDFKDGECKAKDGEDAIKAANDAKTTNTTGSNSFVINKTPLLLAVLLF
uniref:Variant surface glycoprotein 583 n=1 Tax=Trypanosoma brucei TaxID=5691 RepID=M4T0D3_9TRYP|nr:variant surface glycoprotein 583 [Trypanosoma brucei]